MLPGLQLNIPGKLLSNAPDDLFAALGKNDQKIHVVPSKGWVVVRQGEDAGYVGPGGGQVPIYFDNELWAYLNLLECNAVATQTPISNESSVAIFPNPAGNEWNVESAILPEKIELFNALGTRLRSVENTSTLDANDLPAGQYWIKIWVSGKTITKLAFK